MNYPALFEPSEEGGFVITFPDWDWGITQAEDEAEGIAMAADALEAMLVHSIRHGKPVPAPTAPKGKKIRMIELPVVVSVKTELYIAFKASGLTKTGLAKKLDIPKANVDRLFNFKNHTRLDHLEAAFKALGGHLEVSARWAA